MLSMAIVLGAGLVGIAVIVWLEFKKVVACGSRIADGLDSVTLQVAADRKVDLMEALQQKMDLNERKLLAELVEYWDKTDSRIRGLNTRVNLRMKQIEVLITGEESGEKDLFEEEARKVMAEEDSKDPEAKTSIYDQF